VDRLINDALDIVAAIGHSDRRFHLVVHDWGASLAWQIADQHPERLASPTILCRPHPLAFARALEMTDGEQRRRSGHHRTFLEPDAGPNILADNANWLRKRLTKNSVLPAAIEAHLSVTGNPAAMEAAFAQLPTRLSRSRPDSRSEYRLATFLKSRQYSNSATQFVRSATTAAKLVT
jgi:pimeloyl-ACP methyl ester carboxylesterase